MLLRSFIGIFVGSLGVFVKPSLIFRCEEWRYLYFVALASANVNGLP